MLLVNPNRREILKSASLLVSASIFSSPLLARDTKPPLNFLVVGDWGRDGGDYQRHVAVQMERTADAMRSRFVVSTGDNFYNLGVSSKRDSQWASSFVEIYRTRPSLDKPWFPVLGNHDYGGNVYAQVERQERDPLWRMDNRWYDLDPPKMGREFGRDDVHLFFIDTVAWKGREAFPYFLLGSSINRRDRERQEAWLRTTLSASQAPIKLVFGHHPIYSVGKHGGQMDMQDLDCILRDEGVTAYINGHDHCLYHISHAGMPYICSGGGSEELARFTGDRRVPGCVLPGQCSDPPSPIWHSFVDRAGFAAFTIGDDRVDFRFVDRAGLVSPWVTCPARRRAVAPTC